MFYYQILGIVLFVIYIITFLFILLSKKVFFKGLLLNASSGLIVLFVLKLLENIVSVPIYINSVTVGSSLILGIPGVLINLLINLIFI